MAEFSEYAPGTPCWTDVGTTDVAAATDFYGNLFGWKPVDLGPDAGGYGMFELRGKLVAGVGPVMAEGHPPSWSTYVSVEDADGKVGAVKEHGGTVFMEPTDIFDAGRMAVCVDPTGAPFAIWQPRQHIGAQLASEPNTLGWNELNTRDVEAATRFYGAVFGWDANTVPMGPTGTYTEWKLDDRQVGGMLDMTANVPAEIPPHWLTYFNVTDTDVTVALATELGGSVFVPPMDIEPGRFSVIADPQGAWFAVMQVKQ